VICFLDASCFIRRITADGPGAFDWDTWDSLSDSELARVEVGRTFNRLRVTGVWSAADYEASMARFAELAAGIDWLPLSGDVLTLAAEATPMHLKTLDAIHLATARVVRETAGAGGVFATHDRRLAAAAKAFGFETAGV
jgi:predicted nucleic acid-binding protein